MTSKEQINTQDGFKNIIKGLGTSKDARIYNQFTPGFRIDQNLANNLYTYNWICGTAVDAPVEDAIQNWRTLLIEDPQQRKEVEDIMKSFDLKGKVELALKWARVFGGSAIIPILDGEELSEPLDISRIKKDSLKNLVVLDRYKLQASHINRDVFSDNHGNPDFYTVTAGGQQVHHSRVIRFDGKKSTMYQLELENYWGTSLFTRLWEPISDSQTVSQSISNLIFESNVDVYMIKNLKDLVRDGLDDIVKKRLKLTHEMKSIINGIILDADDTYDKKTNNFSNLADLDDRFIYKVAGAIPMPITRLIGREPSGLNASGEGDEKIYNKSLLAIQDNQIRPALDQLDPIIMASSIGEVEDFDYIFNPTQLASPAQQADIDLKNAQRDTIYLTDDVIEPIDAKSELANKGTYLTITTSRIKQEVAATEELFPEEETEEVEDNG